MPIVAETVLGLLFENHWSHVKMVNRLAQGNQNLAVDWCRNIRFSVPPSAEICLSLRTSTTVHYDIVKYGQLYNIRDSCDIFCDNT
jgi:hypothetical protein